MGLALSRSIVAALRGRIGIDRDGHHRLISQREGGLSLIGDGASAPHQWPMFALALPVPVTPLNVDAWIRHSGARPRCTKGQWNFSQRLFIWAWAS